MGPGFHHGEDVGEATAEQCRKFHQMRGSMCFTHLARSPVGHKDAKYISFSMCSAPALEKRVIAAGLESALEKPSMAVGSESVLQKPSVAVGLESALETHSIAVGSEASPHRG